jgi:hypothetical protein
MCAVLDRAQILPSSLIPLYHSGNVLAGGTAGVDDLRQSIVFGDTYSFGPRIVNSFRIGGNRSSNILRPDQFFGAKDVGINMHQVAPDIMALQMTGGFNLGAITGMRIFSAHAGGHVNDDLGVIGGYHQVNFGVSANHTNSSGNQTSSAFARFQSARDPRIMQFALKYVSNGLSAHNRWASQ